MPQHSRGRRHFSLRLLGQWQLVADGEDVALGHREQRLLALLALCGQSSRPHLAGILWPGTTDSVALARLRRAALLTHRRCPGLLQLQPHRLTIGLAADVDVDVHAVRRAAAATEHALTEGEAGALLRQLVGEELLPDWYDDWVLRERASLEQLRAEALERIARQALEAGDLERSVHAARAASDVDPLLESAAEVAIRAHLGRDDLDSAMLEFGRYRDAMNESLGVPPSRAILELVEPVPTESGTAVDSPDEDMPEPVPVATPATATPAVRRITGGRRVGVRLLGVAALILVAALAVAGVGPERDGGDSGVSNDSAASSDTAASEDTGPSGDTGASGATVQPVMRVLPAGRAIRPGQLGVRLVDVAAGRAAFLVRTTVQPMQVRIEVRDDAGRSIVRSVLVRSPQGHRLELSGLQPGIYQWLATSSVASAVSGQLRIPDPPVAVASSDTVEAGGSLPTAATAPTPQPSSDSPQPHPTPRPHPSGPPKDPGTRPLTPIG